MKFAAPLLLAIPVLLSAQAMADCAMLTEPKPFTTTIKNAYSPVVDGDGMRQPGCIVETANGQTGYMPYDYICKLPSDQSIELQPGYGCCDTGPDSGDLTCTVRVNRLGGLSKIRANGLSLSPTKLDVRAVADLAAALKGELTFREHGAALKLAEYIKNPTYTKEVAAIKSDLESIVADNTLHLNKRGYAAYVLMQYPQVSDDAFARLFVTFLEMQPIFDQITVPLIRKAATLPKQADVFAPQLIDYLKRQYYTETIAPEILTALEKLSSALRPQLPKLLAFEYEWSDRGAQSDFKQRTAYWQRMEAIACSISAEDVANLPRDAYQQSKQRFSCTKNK